MLKITYTLIDTREVTVTKNQYKLLPPLNIFYFSFLSLWVQMNLFIYSLGFWSHLHLQGHMVTSSFYWWKKTPHVQILEYPHVLIEPSTQCRSTGRPPHESFCTNRVLKPRGEFRWRKTLPWNKNKWKQTTRLDIAYTKLSADNNCVARLPFEAGVCLEIHLFWFLWHRFWWRGWNFF